MTDFGLRDAYVGVLKGIIAKLAPKTAVIDLCHSIQPQNIKHGRAILKDNFQYFPDDSIFCCVVDPEVGSARKPLVILHQNRLFIGPDNGLLSDFASDRNIWELPFEKDISNTFHGRDIFAPWAARLAVNRNLLNQFKRCSMSDIQNLSITDVQINHKWQNIDVIYNDHFGNLITNGIYEKGKLEVRVNNSIVKVFTHYSEMPPDTFAAIVGSSDRLEISVRNGNAFALPMPDLIEARSF
tara:strand:+ start:605 stop:1324 length:720 start_codon:yes stop_codon:yes gene_type:complete